MTGSVAPASASPASCVPWKAPHEVLSALVEYVPTFYVPIHCVAAILSDESRAYFLGRGKFHNFLRRYPFFFDTRTLDSGARVDVRLRDDVSHPRRGVADEKFMMVDVGEITNYVAKPEFIISLDSIEQLSQNVNVVPPSAPPSVRVELEERVPVLERLRALIPSEFTAVEALEEEMPEDILFHPYFDCQGGLSAIAAKFPQHFQTVDGAVRLRPPHLAPLALNDFTLETSPLPDVAELIRVHVCNCEVPRWVSLTSLYEQLTREQKRQIKKGFKSFAGFLRAHGRSVAVSSDMLQVSKWVCAVSGTPPSENATATPSKTAAAPRADGAAAATPAVAAPAAAAAAASAPAVRLVYTQTQVLNELYDRLPPHRTLSLTEALALLPKELAAFSLPKKVLPWLATYPQYFTVDDPTEVDPSKARVRRATATQPLDLALAVYGAWPQGSGAPRMLPEEAVLEALPSRQRAVVEGIGLQTLADLLPEWLRVEVTDAPPARLVHRLQSVEALEEAIRTEESSNTA